MNGTKRVLVIGIAVALAVSIIPVAAFLEITAPMDLSLTVEAYGSSPTLDIIDNTGDTAGANAACMHPNDKYKIDFGNCPSRAPRIIPSLNQRVAVGDCEDPIFELENHYDKRLLLDLWVSVPPPEGLVIEVWENMLNPSRSTWVQWTIDDHMSAWTLHPQGIAAGDPQVGFRAHAPIGQCYIDPGEDYNVFVVIKTGPTYTDHNCAATSYTPVLKLVATAVE